MQRKKSDVKTEVKLKEKSRRKHDETLRLSNKQNVILHKYIPANSINKI